MYLPKTIQNVQVNKSKFNLEQEKYLELTK
jgi:hypothetical protein